MQRQNIPLVDRVEISGKRIDFSLSRGIVNQAFKIRDNSDSSINIVHVDCNYKAIMARRMN